MRQANMSVLNPIGVTPSHDSLSRLAALDEVDAVVYFTFGKAAEGYSGLHGNVDYFKGGTSGGRSGAGDDYSSSDSNINSDSNSNSNSDSDSDSDSDSSTPVIGARMNLWGEGTSGDKVGVDTLVRELKTLPTDPTDAASYSVVVVNMGSHNYSDVVKAGKLLLADGGFDVVLPEVLISRLAVNTRRQVTCPLPSGSWGSIGEAGDLPKCSVAGSYDRNGSCTFTCSNMVVPDVPIPVSCDLRVCHNLSLTPDKRNFLCPDGSVCPGGASGGSRASAGV